jgi:sulfatase maturation enzyme AslB (radical SAM superfamily)
MQTIIQGSSSILESVEQYDRTEKVEEKIDQFTNKLASKCRTCPVLPGC